jgi:hypothetical protein
MLDAIKISQLPFLTGSIETNAVIVIVQNGKTYRLNYSTITAGTGGAQTLSYNAETGVFSLSGGGGNISITAAEVTAATAATFQIPAGKLLEKVVVIPNGNQTFSIGTTAGNNDIFTDSATNGVPYVLQLDRYSIGGETVHFTATDAVFKIYFK